MASPAQTPPQGGPRARQTPQPAPSPKPYVPTDAENAYLAKCGEAITAGSDAAATAAAAANGGEFLQFAQGVKALTDAYAAIKHGGNVSRHQGA